MRLFQQTSRTTGALFLLLLAPFALSGQESDAAYGYFRVVEGDSSTLIQAETGDREEIEQHRPILVGDEVLVGPAGRLEIILPSFDLLRLDGATELIFEELAGSPDTNDDETKIHLLEGELQLVLLENPQASQRPVSQGTVSVSTRDATVYFHDAGSYRVGLDASRRLRVVVREGYAEVVTDQGSSVLRAGDEALVRTGLYPSTRIADAPAYDSLERWGEDLWRQGEDARYAYEDAYEEDGDAYDSRLRYAAAPLDDHGDWIRVEGRRAWRPYRSDGWRPYFDGRWVSTPQGLSWVSYEPWGWVPYHYGGWDQVDGFGWVWFPGRHFSVAHVNWYWGQDYAAWYPSAYYNRHYGWNTGRSFRFAGWGGGSWGPYRDWVFCPTIYLGRQRQHRYARTGRSVREYTGWNELPRGIITTDTRQLTPETWRNPQRVEDVLRRKLRSDDNRDGIQRELPDLTAYVARDPNTSSEALLRKVRQGRVQEKLQDVRPRRVSEPKIRASSNGRIDARATDLRRDRDLKDRDRRKETLEERRPVTNGRPVAGQNPRSGRLSRETTKPTRPSSGEIQRRVESRAGNPSVPKTSPRVRPETKREVRPPSRVEQRRPTTKPERRIETTRPTVQNPRPPKTKSPARSSGSLERRTTTVREKAPRSTAPRVRAIPPRTNSPKTSAPRTSSPKSGSVSRRSAPPRTSPKSSRSSKPTAQRKATQSKASQRSTAKARPNSKPQPNRSRPAPKKRPQKDKN